MNPCRPTSRTRRYVGGSAWSRQRPTRNPGMDIDISAGEAPGGENQAGRGACAAGGDRRGRSRSPRGRGGLRPPRRHSVSDFVQGLNSSSSSPDNRRRSNSAELVNGNDGEGRGRRRSLAGRQPVAGMRARPRGSSSLGAVRFHRTGTRRFRPSSVNAQNRGDPHPVEIPDIEIHEIDAPVDQGDQENLEENNDNILGVEYEPEDLLPPSPVVAREDAKLARAVTAVIFHMDQIVTICQDLSPEQKSVVRQHIVPRFDGNANADGEPGAGPVAVFAMDVPPALQPSNSQFGPPAANERNGQSARTFGLPGPPEPSDDIESSSSESIDPLDRDPALLAAAFINLPPILPIDDDDELFPPMPRGGMVVEDRQINLNQLLRPPANADAPLEQGVVEIIEIDEELDPRLRPPQEQAKNKDDYSEKPVDELMVLQMILADAGESTSTPNCVTK